MSDRKRNRDSEYLYTQKKKGQRKTRQLCIYCDDDPPWEQSFGWTSINIRFISANRLILLLFDLFPFFSFSWKKYYSIFFSFVLFRVPWSFSHEAVGRSKQEEKNGNAHRNYYEANKCIGTNEKKNENRKEIEQEDKISIELNHWNCVLLFFGVIFYCFSLLYLTLHHSVRGIWCASLTGSTHTHMWNTYENKWEK